MPSSRKRKRKQPTAAHKCALDFWDKRPELLEMEADWWTETNEALTAAGHHKVKYSTAKYWRSSARRSK
jgi:hypothetical protein